MGISVTVRNKIGDLSEREIITKSLFFIYLLHSLYIYIYLFIIYYFVTGSIAVSQAIKCYLCTSSTDGPCMTPDNTHVVTCHSRTDSCTTVFVSYGYQQGGVGKNIDRPILPDGVKL